MNHLHTHHSAIPRLRGGFARTILGALALVGVVSLAAAPAHAGEVLDQIREEGVLKVATDSNWAPQSFLNENNELDGFDVDIAKEIAARMGVDIEFVTPDWTLITAGNWGGRWDLSVGSMTPTKERGRVLDFPVVYHYASVGVAVHNDSDAQTLADLEGRRVAACTSCTGELYLNKELSIDAPGVAEVEYPFTAGEIVSMEQPAAMFDDLRLGDGVRLDAVVDSLAAMREVVERGYPIRIIGVAFNEPLALAIDKGDAEFGAALAEVVTSMHADGTISALSQEWYGEDYSQPIQ